MDTIFRFAIFEADRELSLLRHKNRRVKIERIPLELLFLLLENHGRVVTREQIVERLWGNNQFLDTERSTNTAIRKIRRALSDDPRNPRYIETVVGKGYRFVSHLMHAVNESSATSNLIPSSPQLRSATRTDDAVILKGFALELENGKPTLSCEASVSGVFVGRLQLAELQIPSDMTLPLKPEDKLLIRLLGIRVNVTPATAQSLHAVCISLLQSGIPIEVKEPVRLGSVGEKTVNVAAPQENVTENSLLARAN